MQTPDKPSSLKRTVSLALRATTEATQEMNRSSLFLAKKSQNLYFIKKRLVYTIVLARRRTCTDHLVNNATHVQAQTSLRLT